MPNVLVFNSDNPAAPYLSGEVGLGMLWNGSAAAAGIFWVDSLAIAKNAKNVEAAHKMIDFLLRPEIAAKISEETGYLTAVEKSNAK